MTKSCGNLCVRYGNQMLTYRKIKLLNPYIIKTHHNATFFQVQQLF